MPAIDPDAPWWANLLLLAFVALVPTVFALRAKHAATKAADVAETTHAESVDKLDRVLHNVENSHQTGLRDDIDEKLGALARLVNLVRDDVGGLHSEVRDARIDIGRVQHDVTVVRGEARRDRRRIGGVERRLATALETAQDIIDHNNPDGPQLLAGYVEDPDDEV
jgi:hypothetical protein